MINPYLEMSEDVVHGFTLHNFVDVENVRQSNRRIPVTLFLNSGSHISHEENGECTKIFACRFH